jgi:uncharacterized protein
MNLWAIFLTGLTTGGLTCVAMQGGLLASVIASQKKADIDTHAATVKKFDLYDWLPVVLFLVAKLISHTLLGALLGWLGSRFEMALGVRLFFQLLAALFMFAAAGNLLELHPLFRYVVFQPPHFIRRLLRQQSKGAALFTPALLGFLTIFVPCGVTQSMELVAITSGNAVIGALIMFFFVLGTSPIFAVVGVGTARLSEKLQGPFLKLAAALLIFLALSSINGILIVMNSPITFQKVTRPITYFFSAERFEYAAGATGTPAIVDGVQPVSIIITNRGYTPNYIRVKHGVPVKLTITTKEVYSCASSFVLPAFDIATNLRPTDTQTFEFTPTEAGQFQYTCSMGMYTGILEVI